MRKLFLATIALLGLCGAVAFGNYSATQGSGTTFGSVVTGGVHYVQMFLCDLTTASQCAAVDSSGNVSVKASTLPLPTGAATSANQATEIASLATIATNTGAPIPAGSAIIGKVSIDQTTPGTTNLVALSTETTKVIGTTRNFDGTGNNINADPCERTQQTSAPISITTATTTRIVAPSSSNKTYICYLFLTSVAADNIGIVEGTGGTCGSGTTGVIGGSTAANGPNFAANSGAAFSAGGKVAVAVTAGTNVDLCLITSAATPLAGVIKYVQAP